MMRVWKKALGGGKKTLNTNFVLVAKIHASSQVDAPKAYRARCGQRKQHDEALGKSAGGGKMTYYEFCFAAKIHASSQSRCNKAHAPKPYHARCGQHN